MENPYPLDSESVLAELDLIRDGLSRVLDSLSEEEMAALILEAEAFFAQIQSQSEQSET